MGDCAPIRPIPKVLQRRLASSPRQADELQERGNEEAHQHEFRYGNQEKYTGLELERRIVGISDRRRGRHEDQRAEIERQMRRQGAPDAGHAKGSELGKGGAERAHLRGIMLISRERTLSDVAGSTTLPADAAVFWRNRPTNAIHGGGEFSLNPGFTRRRTLHLCSYRAA